MASNVVVRVDRLAAGGDGVGRLRDGCVVFIPQSAPGDLLAIEIVERRRRFARGRIDRVIEASPLRVAPRCTHVAACGGCNWQHLPHAVQLAAKRDIVADALRRIGSFSTEELAAAFSASRPPIVGSPAAYGYRGRARLHVETGRVGYRASGSSVHCPVRECPVLVPPLEAALGGAEVGGFSEGGELELFAGSEDQVRISALGSDAAQAPAVELLIAGDRLRISPGVFSQSNALLVEQLANDVVSAAAAGAANAAESAVLELFAGAGLFTLGLARCFASVVAVEGNRAAASDLRFNLERAGRIERCRVRVEPVVEVLEGALVAQARVVVLDPPRAGLGAAATRRMAQLGAQRIVYLSCDPATLARDLRTLCDADPAYAISSVQAYDLFPQTAHVETLVVIERDVSR